MMQKVKKSIFCLVAFVVIVSTTAAFGQDGLRSGFNPHNPAELCYTQRFTRNPAPVSSSSDVWLQQVRGEAWATGWVIATSATGRFWARTEIRDRNNGTFSLGNQHWVNSGSMASSATSWTRYAGRDPLTERLFFGNAGNDPGR